MIFKTENEFDPIIKQEWGIPVVYDGIIKICEYNKTAVKILWILKEGNENTEQEERDHRDFHLDVARYYSGWKSTYKNIILPTYGMFHNLSYKDLPELSDDATVNNEYVLDKIALINVNKNGGGSTANTAIIEKNYSDHKDVLMQQIDSISPNVIINCSRVNRLFDDVCKKYCLVKKKFDFRPEFDYVVDYAENSEKVLINYWHPGAHMSDEAYQKQLLVIYNKWRANKNE